MKLFVFTFLVLPLFVCSQGPKECIEQFFEAFNDKDTSQLRELLHPNVTMKTILNTLEGETQVIDENLEQFLIVIGDIPEDVDYQEKIHSYQVQQENYIAQVWTPYTFYLFDEYSHKGTNAFTLVKMDGIWKIIFLIDTRERE